MGNELTAREATKQIRLHQWQQIITERQSIVIAADGPLRLCTKRQN